MIKLKYNIKILVKLFFIITILFACDNKPFTDDSLIGITENELFQRIGHPNRSSTFLLNDSLFEYQNNLKNLLNEENDDHIIIKEMIWESKNERFVAWSIIKNKKRIIIDNIKWNKNKLNF